MSLGEAREAGGPAPDLRIREDAGQLGREACAIFVSRAKESVASRGRFDVLLSGGSTPKRMFELLAELGARPGEAPDWRRVHLFWGDERMVPPGDPESNYGMTRGRLLSRVPIPEDNVHRVHGELEDAGEAARRYEAEARRHFPDARDFPVFDLVFLGLGSEGHTASLFPDSTDEPDGPRWFFAPWIAKLGQFRVSASLGVLNAAREVVFLVSGEGKSEVLKKILEPSEHHGLLPAQRVRPRPGALIWLVDRPAARLILA